jgi:L-seryl-tRNA(Ser) seleniumtransferase
VTDPGRNRRRDLPSVDFVIGHLTKGVPHEIGVDAARRALDEARARIESGTEVTRDDVARRAQEFVDETLSARLQPVINATGVLLHTNLGRAPLGERQIDAVVAAATSYGTLEYELATGTRGKRGTHIRNLVRAMTGAEDAFVVNNNAGATLLVLAGLCGGREVVVSRGELVEIGGEFRIPDIAAAAGVTLREVGTTNRTRLADYERAIRPETGALLKVHPSNYRIVGFTAEASGRDLARLARARGIPFVHDIGSGLLRPWRDHPWLAGEPAVSETLRDGADVVLFSGDKLLGGPQAGIILGRSKIMEALARHPLARALRPDKMTLAALEATLMAYAEDEPERLPLWRLAAVAQKELLARAERLCERLTDGAPGVEISAEETDATAGGGSSPSRPLPSAAVIVTTDEPDEFAARLRMGSPPVVARIADDRVVLDLRTVFAEQDDALLSALAATRR